MFNKLKKNMRNILLNLFLYINLINSLNLSKKQVDNNDNFNKNDKTIEVLGVEGHTISLPCPLSAPSRDKVYMVLWFRDDAGIPLYSFDVRGKPLSQARHWSAPEIFGSRAKFNTDIDPAALDLTDIKRHDQGIYRCRVDFRTSQTQSFRYNLTIIIPPEYPIILNRWGRQLNTTNLGPLEEGDDVSLTCRVIGGRPQPKVRWLINGIVVDEEYEQNFGDVIENRLLWPSVQRTDLNSIFTCQAINTKLIDPKEFSLVLDLYLKPLNVYILNSTNQLISEKRYEITCQSFGSKPNAIITWYKGKKQLRRTKDEIINNTSISELSFVPTSDDDGKIITCRAENPKVSGLFLDTTWKLNVVYPPMVTLRLGSTLSADDIKEGDDVYLECEVLANPSWRKLSWLQNGITLPQNVSTKVIRSNQSLVLQKIYRTANGNYSCSAINSEGETVSNTLMLNVKYTPVCDTDKIIMLGALKGETINITCNVLGDPPPSLYKWKFSNNSGEIFHIGNNNNVINNKLQNANNDETKNNLLYTPITDQDYGTLSCWGQNEIGIQEQPCTYQIILAEITEEFNSSSIIFGILFTIIILFICLIIKIKINTFKQRQNNTKQLNNDNNYQNSRWTRNGIKNTESKFLVTSTTAATTTTTTASTDLEHDPDVIPSQFVGKDLFQCYEVDKLPIVLTDLYTNNDERQKTVIIASSSASSSKIDLKLQSTEPQQQPQHQEALINYYKIKNKNTINTDNRENDINIHAIKNMLMTTRIPESCV